MQEAIYDGWIDIDSSMMREGVPEDFSEQLPKLKAIYRELTLVSYILSFTSIVSDIYNDVKKRNRSIEENFYEILYTSLSEKFVISIANIFDSGDDTLNLFKLKSFIYKNKEKISQKNTEEVKGYIKEFDNLFKSLKESNVQEKIELIKRFRNSYIAHIIVDKEAEIRENAEVVLPYSEEVLKYAWKIMELSIKILTSQEPKKDELEVLIKKKEKYMFNDLKKRGLIPQELSF